MSGQVEAGGSTNSAPHAASKTLRWASTLISNLPAETPSQGNDAEPSSDPAVTMMKKCQVLQPQSRFDKKWINCELRHLMDDQMLTMLYNTLVQDGELVRPYPPSSYSSPSLGKTAFRGIDGRLYCEVNKLECACCEGSTCKEFEGCNCKTCQKLEREEKLENESKCPSAEQMISSCI